MGQSIYFKEIKVDKNWALVLLFAPWLIGDIAFLILIGYGSIVDGSVDDFWLIWLFFLGFGLIPLNAILWNFRGRESIEVSRHGIVLRKTGMLFPSTNLIGINELEEITFDEDDSLPWWWKIFVNPYRTSDGKVIVKYLGTYKRIGRSLTIQNAKSITDEINEVVKTLTTQNRLESN